MLRPYYGRLVWGGKGLCFSDQLLDAITAVSGVVSIVVVEMLVLISPSNIGITPIFGAQFRAFLLSTLRC